MRVVYYGRELYHAATGAQRDNHQYIARIPVGDRFRYFYNQAELAAYNAGKTAKNAVDTAGKAIKDTVNGIKAKAIQRDLEKKGVGKINTSLGDAYKTTNWSQQVHDRQLRDNLVNNKSLRNPPAWMPGKNGPKNNQGIASTTGKNNAPKNNQGIASTNNSSKKVGINSQDIMKQDLSDKAKHHTNQGIVGKTYAEGRNRPKNNQGIARIKDSGNAPKNNQGIAPTSNKANNKKNYLYPEAAKLSRQADILADKFAKSRTRYENEPSDSKTKESKLNAYVINGERLIDNFKKTEDVLNKYRGISRPEKKSNAPKVSGKFLTNKGSVYDSSKINNNSISAGSGRLDNGTADKFHVNTKAQTNKELSNAKRQKEIELSFYNSYVNDGHNSADARRWAKKAAENYMKKHK